MSVFLGTSRLDTELRGDEDVQFEDLDEGSGDDAGVERAPVAQRIAQIRKLWLLTGGTSALQRVGRGGCGDPLQIYGLEHLQQEVPKEANM